MQVSVESKGALEREMRVEVPEERIASEVDSRLKSLSRTTRVRGFRPGKAPFKVIEQRYGDQVRREVIGEVMQASFYEAVSREKLRPAGRPAIEPLPAPGGQGLVYTARFEVFPEVKLANVEKLEIRKPVCTIGDADVDKMIETLRRQRRRMVAVERAAGDGDVVEVDFEGRIGGEPFEGGAAKGFRVEIGSGSLIDGFEDGLKGVGKGEDRTLPLRFPDDYGKSDLAGKEVEFSVHVNQVSEYVLPELNAEFFAEFGVKDGDEQAFRKEVREHMEREAAVAARNRQRDAVMDALHAAHEVELPASLIRQEQHQLQHQFEANLKAYGIKLPEGQAQGDESRFEEQARKRVALQIIVAELIRDKELKADPAKVRALIEKNAESYEDPSAVISWYYADPKRLSEVEAVALEDAVIDFVAEHARSAEAPVSFDELMNKGQTESA